MALEIAHKVPPFRGLRTPDYVFVKYGNGQMELYDLVADPVQLDNLAAAVAPALLDQLSARVAELRDCEADGCRTAEDAAVPDL